MATRFYVGELGRAAKICCFLVEGYCFYWMIGRFIRDPDALASGNEIEMTPEPNKHFTLTLIADTGDRFSDFTPYVASLNDHGVVAFQAALRAGGTGVFTGTGGAIVAVADTTDSPFGSFYSHPDIDNNGSLSVFAELKSGLQGVFVARDGRLSATADTSSAFACIGPLGPTMNDCGTVVFRADTRSGDRGVFVATEGAIRTIADTGSASGRFLEVRGLPVLDGKGTVVFGAALAGGGEGIYAGSSAGSNPLLHTIANTNDLFAHLGAFPCINDAGTVVFSATLKSGGTGIYAVSHGETSPVIEADDGFESFRGALINNVGTVIFYATPQGGHLGIYAVLDATVHRLLSIGDPLFGSTVVEFALNPVSVNHVDQVAIRIRLANDRQVIVRADRVA